MEELAINITKLTPRITTNSGVVEIYGISMPERAVEFYEPILKWIEDYMDEGGDIKFIFKFYYLNSASVHCIKNIIKKADLMGNIMVEWYYEFDDEGIEMTGKFLSQSMDIEFEMIESGEIFRGF